MPAYLARRKTPRHDRGDPIVRMAGIGGGESVVFSLGRCPSHSVSRKGVALPPYNIISGVERLPRDTSPKILCHYAGFHVENCSLGVLRWPGRGLEESHALVVRYLLFVVSMMSLKYAHDVLLTHLYVPMVAVVLLLQLLLIRSFFFFPSSAVSCPSRWLQEARDGGDTPHTAPLPPQGHLC